MACHGISFTPCQTRQNSDGFCTIDTTASSGIYALCWVGAVQITRVLYDPCGTPARRTKLRVSQPLCKYRVTQDRPLTRRNTAEQNVKILGRHVVLCRDSVQRRTKRAGCWDATGPITRPMTGSFHRSGHPQSTQKNAALPQSRGFPAALSTVKESSAFSTRCCSSRAFGWPAAAGWPHLRRPMIGTSSAVHMPAL